VSDSIVAVVLAAGESARMGFPKALLPLGERTFLETILDVLAEVGLEDVRVVVGGHADRVLPAVAKRGARPVVNAEFAAGQLSSIRKALATLDTAVEACLFWPVDQPAVSAALVGRILEAYRATRPPIVLPVCGGRRGHPALIARPLFAELLALDGTEGAKPVMLRHRSRTVLVETRETGTVQDVDTPDDYRRLTGEALDAALARLAAAAPVAPSTRADGAAPAHLGPDALPADD
jgi:molybdenum cofactor cytidylyltransferase